MSLYYPKKQGLYDPSFEHESCGIGFVAHLKGKKSHGIIRDGIQILENLSHRGACGCDPLTGDGAGILIQMPDAFLRKVCEQNKIELPELGQYAAGIVFLPQNLEERNTIEQWFEQIIREEGLKFLGWRDTPHEPNKIGKVARSVMPEFKQIFVGWGSQTESDAFERKLFVTRKRLEKMVRESELTQKNYFHVCSFASKTLVYKGQLMAEQVDGFYTDLADKDMVSALAMVHSRYSTNTFPTWALAHPYRMIAHNGEINTLRGNINWMHARENQFISDAFGDDLKKLHPVIEPGLSDSGTFDNALFIELVHIFRTRKIVDINNIILNPIFVWLSGTIIFLKLRVINNAAFRHIDQKHFSRLQAALIENILRFNRKNSCFRGHNNEIIFCHRIS